MGLSVTLEVSFTAWWDSQNSVRAALSIMKNELTEMQRFALATINNYHTGVSANMVAYLWYKSKGINLSVASRRRFGATVAGYNACRALVKKGKATSTTADYGEIFFPIKQTGNV